MAGEVFKRRKHSTFVRAADVGRHHGGDLLWILAEGARVDDRVLRVNLHVRNGVEVPVDAESPRLLGNYFRELLNIGGVVRGAEGHRLGEGFEGGEPHGRAALKVDREDKG